MNGTVKKLIGVMIGVAVGAGIMRLPWLSGWNKWLALTLCILAAPYAAGLAEKRPGK